MKHYMNSIIKLTTLLSAMTLTLVACEKTDNPAGGNTIVTPAAKERTIIYAVSNSENRQVLKTEAEWDAMLERFCDQAALYPVVNKFSYQIVIVSHDLLRYITLMPPYFLIFRIRHEPSPKTLSIADLYLSVFSFLTNACIVPANPPP